MARRKEGGGFSQTPRLPATVEDTYYALRSLSVLEEAGIEVEHRCFQGHDAFLEAKMDEGVGEPRVAYQLGWIAARLGRRDLLDRLAAMEFQTAHDLSGRYYARRLVVLRGEEPGPDLSLDGRAVKTVQDLRMFLYLKGATPSSQLKEEWRGWLLACQNGDGGFGFMPGTTSYMDNCYYAIRAMAQVGMRPLECKALLGFVESARSGRGGFGRKHAGVPFPSSTWHAVATLRFLDQGYSW